MLCFCHSSRFHFALLFNEDTTINDTNLSYNWLASHTTRSVLFTVNVLVKGSHFSLLGPEHGGQNHETFIYRTDPV